MSENKNAVQRVDATLKGGVIIVPAVIDPKAELAFKVKDENKQIYAFASTRLGGVSVKESAVEVSIANADSLALREFELVDIRTRHLVTGIISKPEPVPAEEPGVVTEDPAITETPKKKAKG